MKKLTLLLICLMFGLAVFAQSRPVIPQAIKNVPLENVPIASVDESLNVNPAHSDYKFGEWTEENIGETVYDLQSNYACQNRLYLFDDGTMGATWTRGFEEPNFPDRGSGYNFFDGSSWGDIPTARVESTRCGWPSYMQYGLNGEMIIAHTGGDNGLVMNYRTNRGSGAWTEMFFAGPTDHEDIIWPRVVTSGADLMTLHVFAVTTPLGNGGSLYMGMDGAMVYSRSTDGGATWDDENIILDGMGPDYYTHTGGDYYAIANPVGDNIAFVMASKWQDMYLMKSEDNGVTWDKTMIFEHPYPFFDWNVTVTDTFFCPDGAVAIALDNDGIAHVTFGITRVGHFEIGNTYTAFPFYDGLGYWREGMPAFEDDDMNLNALDPELLEENVNLIGWTQDLNGNGEWDVIGTVASLGNYRTGISSHPTMTIDENNYIYVVFSSIAETFQTDSQNYRHLFARTSKDGGDTWGDEFYDLTGDIVHVFSECIHPAMADNTDEYIHLIYHEDTEPGQAVQGDLDPYGDNNVPYIKILKPEILGIGDNPQEISTIDFISQNHPNPAVHKTDVNIHLMFSSSLSVHVHNMIGQKVMEIDRGYLAPGVYTVSMDVSSLQDGVYFYTVIAGGESMTKKMIVGN
ncbi:MAG: T9SS type A sorting domain-containing protein [Bacteroidales bacterium]|nr:T9SS type A sorting domain-containing protein [Bacteroidales bacterium]